MANPPVPAEEYVDFYFLDGLFQEEPPEKFSCPICLSPVQREAFLTQCCGKHFCRQCIGRVVQTSRPCPMCKAFPVRIFPNKERQREINLLRVSCPAQIHNTGDHGNGTADHENGTTDYSHRTKSASTNTGTVYNTACLGDGVESASTETISDTADHGNGAECVSTSTEMVSNTADHGNGVECVSTSTEMVSNTADHGNGAECASTSTKTVSDHGNSVERASTSAEAVSSSECLEVSSSASSAVRCGWVGELGQVKDHLKAVHKGDKRWKACCETPALSSQSQQGGQGTRRVCQFHLNQRMGQMNVTAHAHIGGRISHSHSHGPMIHVHSGACRAMPTSANTAGILTSSSSTIPQDVNTQQSGGGATQGGSEDNQAPSCQSTSSLNQGTVEDSRQQRQPQGQALAPQPTPQASSVITIQVPLSMNSSINLASPSTQLQNNHVQSQAQDSPTAVNTSTTEGLGDMNSQTPYQGHPQNPLQGHVQNSLQQGDLENPSQQGSHQNPSQGHPQDPAQGHPQNSSPQGQPPQPQIIYRGALFRPGRVVIRHGHGQLFRGPPHHGGHHGHHQHRPPHHGGDGGPGPHHGGPGPRHHHGGPRPHSHGHPGHGHQGGHCHGHHHGHQ